MRSLTRARSVARQVRAQIGYANDKLYERIISYIEKHHQIEVQAVPSAALFGSKAEVRADDAALFYDEALEKDEFEKLFVILHELGHLELHHRLKSVDEVPNLIIGAIYASDGAAALARYNPRAQEEAEANAFAREFLCPGDEVFRRWQSEDRPDSRIIAESLNLPQYLVRAQLAEALALLAMGDGEQSTKKKQKFECDKSQLAAAKFVGAPALVNAGPGTGKTATLVRRIVYLLDEIKTQPENILVLTFSNEAAEELQSRIAARFGDDIASRIKVGTFHGFGVEILFHHGQFVNLDSNFGILDEIGQQEFVSRILAETECRRILRLSRLDESIEGIVKHINYLKERLHTPDDLEAALRNWQPIEEEKIAYLESQEFLNVFRKYEEIRQVSKLVDFSDLIAAPIKILQEQDEVRHLYREQYKWVLVDEYQDVCRSVAKLLKLLCGADNPPWVVGDPRQAIFRFRGAAPENVIRFEQDFPDVERFNLNTNYRSCPEVIEGANQLAALMQSNEDAALDFEAWRPHQDNPIAFGETPLSVAFGNSDKAEQLGIVAQVRKWLEQGASLNDIAVLARRNVDVRNIVLALGENGIPATTNGLATSEGAAGDLAGIITFPDRPRASIPRLAYALGKNRFAPETIDFAINLLLDHLEQESPSPLVIKGEVGELIAEVTQAGDVLAKEKFSGDAFNCICAFLFEGSDYLRRILAEPESAARGLAIDEIVTSIVRAASYRFSHPKDKPLVARRGFADYFRNSLSSNQPSLLPPKENVDAVRVMTCHAAKGLEFPLVIVAGQASSIRFSKKEKTFDWLPMQFQPDKENDRRQADSLLFVGITRAKRAMLVTYAGSRSGTSRSESRETADLLGQWVTAHNVFQDEFPPSTAQETHAEVELVWGGSLSQPLASRTLSKDSCTIRTYLNDFARIKFPSSHSPLYPIFFQLVRASLEQIVELAHSQISYLSEQEAENIFFEKWSQHESVAGHMHERLFGRIGRRYVNRFANAYGEVSTIDEYLDITFCDETTGLPLRLELVKLYRTTNGEVIAIAFRPESLNGKINEKGLLWGKFEAHRNSLVLLKERFPDLRAFVFSGEDGTLHEFQWTKPNYYNQGVQALNDRVDAFSRGVFKQKIEEYNCDKCTQRVTCPHWIKTGF
ncbi:MAG: UvrD-helicase domain-containing protein [Acidobacteria bacterium]|nr:UvrD-helicase domain-containing protein [Acidobacteriota bacterium]